MAAMKRTGLLLSILVSGLVLFYLYLYENRYLCGQISDETTGSPLAGAMVTLGHRSVLTDAAGHYCLKGVKGTLRVSVKAPG